MFERLRHSRLGTIIRSRMDSSLGGDWSPSRDKDMVRAARQVFQDLLSRGELSEENVGRHVYPGLDEADECAVSYAPLVTRRRVVWAMIITAGVVVVPRIRIGPDKSPEAVERRKAEAARKAQEAFEKKQAWEPIHTLGMMLSAPSKSGWAIRHPDPGISFKRAERAGTNSVHSGRLNRQLYYHGKIPTGIELFVHEHTTGVNVPKFVLRTEAGDEEWIISPDRLTGDPSGRIIEFTFERGRLTAHFSVEMTNTDPPGVSLTEMESV